MTDYNDLAKINQLYAEQQQIAAAIAIIDADGTLSSFVVTAPPPPPYDPDDPNPPRMPAPPVSIIVAGDVPPELMAALRAQLVQRSDAISAELADLGVDDTPVSTGATK
jgi:hypothetical protein